MISKLNENKISAILVYNTDEDINELLEYDLMLNKSYLIMNNNNNLEIVESKNIPYPDIWIVPWRMKAVKAVQRLFRLG